jgi:hypothetical protein
MEGTSSPRILQMLQASPSLEQLAVQYQSSEDVETAVLNCRRIFQAVEESDKVARENDFHNSLPLNRNCGDGSGPAVLVKCFIIFHLATICGEHAHVTRMIRRMQRVNLSFILV